MAKLARITLVESKHRQILQTIPDYEIHVDGKFFGRAYFNTHGYCTYLPLANGRCGDPGEITLTRLRKEIAKLNQEWAVGGYPVGTQPTPKGGIGR